MAAVTSTDLYDNIRLMMRTAALPLALSAGAYALLAMHNPMLGAENAILTALNLDFNMHPLAILPALVIDPVIVRLSGQELSGQELSGQVPSGTD